MKKLKVFKFALILILAAFVFAAVWDYGIVKWNSGESYADSLITTNADTSDWVELTYSERVTRGKQYQYPEEIAIELWATESDSTDSTNVTWTLQFSNDQTYVYDYGTIASMTSATSDTNATTVTNVTLGLAHNNQIVSIAESITNVSYDTIVFNSDTTGLRTFGFMYYDSTFSYNVDTTSATQTYTYSSQTDWPKYRYLRLIATLALPAADTLTVGSKVAKLYKE